MSRRNKRRARHRASSPPVDVAPTETAPTPSLVIRGPESPEDLKALHLLMLMQGEECAPVPVNADKVWDKLIDACSDPANHYLLLAIKDGHLAGFLNLYRSGFWYSDATMITDFGFYVLPAYRGGDVGPALLQEARTIADQSGERLFIFINNPGRKRGGPMERRVSLLGYDPAGSVLAFGNEAEQPSALQ